MINNISQINQIHNIKENTYSIFNKNPLIIKMDEMRDEFRSLLGTYDANPSEENLTELSGFMYHMRSFMQEHKKDIFELAKENLWPAFHNEDGYEGFYDSTMLTINTFLNPSFHHNQANLTFINEQFTQLTWLC